MNQSINFFNNILLHQVEYHNLILQESKLVHKISYRKNIRKTWTGSLLNGKYFDFDAYTRYYS